MATSAIAEQDGKSYKRRILPDGGLLSVMVLLLGIMACKPQQRHGISFWILSENKNEGGQYIDTKEFPKLGFVGATPDLTITRIKRVGVQDWGGTKLPAAMTIELLQADAEQFSEFTRRNLGRRVLIKLGERPITAPLIVTPLTNTFQIGFANMSELEVLRKKLEPLVASSLD